MSFFAELKRRNVFRVAAAYAVVVWLLIEVSDTAFLRLGLPEWTVILVIALSLLGFPVALFSAWAYELTPEGLKREQDLDRSESITPHTAKKLDRAIMVVLAFAEDERSIAVLPFVNMSDDPGNEYFSDGISEELLNLLAKIPELRGISRSSAFSFKGQNLELTEIAKRLDVGHILEGSVRKAGNQVRITAQLIDARSDTHLWSETYDRELDDILAIQDEISATVVAQLKITLLGEAPHVEQTDPEAYALYLQGRHLGRLGTAEGYEQSIALIEQALAIDPEYAPAHSRLGWIAMAYDNDLAQAARHFERALQLDPADINIIGNAAGLLFTLGRLDEAIAIFEYVAARDPVNPVGHSNLAGSYRSTGRWDEAVAAYETALRLSPGHMGVHYFMGTALLLNGEAEAALESFTREGDEHYRV